MTFEQQMQQALQSFIAEAKELLETMELGLLELESSSDKEQLNALFRAAHTIKGSAGLFGLDGIVRFTHHLESVLDQMRSGDTGATPDLVALLLAARDHLAVLVGQAEDPQAGHDEAPAEAALVARLQGVLGAGRGMVAAQPPSPAPVRVHVQDPVATAQTGVALTATWHLSLRFGPDCLRNGMDPLAFIRYLRGLGEIIDLVTLADALPPLDVMDPETAYLGFEMNFSSTASKEEIEAVFEFVREDSAIRIMPAHSRIADYIELIRSLPEDDLRLGDILVQVGTLTRKELDDALARQDRAQIAGTPSVPLGEILVREGATHAPIVQAALDKQRQTKEKRARDSQMLRVSADKLDGLINLVGELVIASAGNALHVQSAIQHEAAAQVSRLVEEIRERALKLRMVEVGETFARFQRVVREVSRDLGKDIGLVIDGAETEMDKSLVERISDPLMHLVRNSMDHGIEAPSVRVAAGKPAQGTLRLSACHDSGSILIMVSDDGKGLDRERILGKAIDRGLVKAEAAASMIDSDVWQLIFEPGFSTADSVTDLSGRGVGMDVVRRNVEAIRGSIEIQSRAGAGTLIRLRLPLTLAIIDGFMVKGVGRTFVMPLDAVIECLEYQEAENNRKYINIRGEVLPILRLGEAIGSRDGEGDQDRQADVPPPRRNIVVVQNAGQRAGLVVDELLGEYQTVIKPLGALFAHLEGISGSTILGNGEVALILDVSTLLQRASRRTTELPRVAVAPAVA
jgi:two-component system chemotaxis sensor kinase CheA